MANLTNALGYVSNPQFSGGEPVTPLSGTEFAWQNKGYGGLYVGTPGTLVVKTINGNVLTLVSASGYIPGLIGAVSSSSTAANIIGFDPIQVALPTTTTSTSTSTSTTSTSTSTTSTSTSTSTTSTSTTVAPTTSTTTAASISYAYTLYSGSYSGTPCSSPTTTGVGSVNYLTNGPGYPGPTSITVYIDNTILWGPLGPAGISAYTDAGLTNLYTGTGYANLNAWGAPAGSPTGATAIRFFNTGTNQFTCPIVA